MEIKLRLSEIGKSDFKFKIRRTNRFRKNLLFQLALALTQLSATDPPQLILHVLVYLTQIYEHRHR